MRHSLSCALVAMSLVVAGSARAQNSAAPQPPLPTVYGPGSYGSQAAPANAPVRAPTDAPPATAPTAAGAPPVAAMGRQCKALLGEPADARTMICALADPRSIGEDCSCPFPAVPPPGVLPSPPAAGHVTE